MFCCNLEHSSERISFNSKRIGKWTDRQNSGWVHSHRVAITDRKGAQSAHFFIVSAYFIESAVKETKTKSMIDSPACRLAARSNHARSRRKGTIARRGYWINNSKRIRELDRSSRARMFIVTNGLVCSISGDKWLSPASSHKVTSNIANPFVNTVHCYHNVRTTNSYLPVVQVRHCMR